MTLTKLPIRFGVCVDEKEYRPCAGGPGLRMTLPRSRVPVVELLDDLGDFTEALTLWWLSWLLA